MLGCTPYIKGGSKKFVRLLIDDQKKYFKKEKKKKQNSRSKTRTCGEYGEYRHAITIKASSV